MVSRNTGRTTIELVFSQVINTALAKAVISHLELPHGVQLPAYLSSPNLTCYEDLVEAVVKDLGPVFMCWTRLVKGFSMTRTLTTITRRWLATCFAPFASVCWQPG